MSEEKNSVDRKHPLDEENNQVTTPYLCFCLIVCAIGCSFPVGWNTSIYNTPVQVFKEFFNDTYTYQYSKAMSESTWTSLWSIANGLLPLGGMFGGMASGQLADYFGRKKLILLTNLLVLIAGVTTIMSKFVYSYIPFIIGRFITGIYCGLFSGVAPLYLTEIAPKSIRGMAGALHQLSLVIGLFLASIFGLPSLFGTKELWSLLIGFTFLPSVLLLACFPFCVESPKSTYITHNSPKEALEDLKKLRGSKCEESLQIEMNELESEKKFCSTQNSVSYMCLFTKRNFKRPLVITIVIQLSQQLCGINTVGMYSTNLFVSIGLDAKTWAIYASILIYVLNIFVTILCNYLIEISGRRKLLLFGFSGMAVFSFAIAILPVISPGNNFFEYLTLVATAAYTSAFALGPGSIPWIITAELFTSDARGKATSIAIMVNWLGNFIIATVTPLLMAEIHNNIFLIYAFLILFFVTFIYFKLPETKQKTSEEISRHFLD